MGKRCKVLIVAIMIAAIAVTGGIVSLGSANADNEILDTTRYVTVSGATAPAAQDKSGTVTHKGLLLTSEIEGSPYSGNINGIFKGNSKFTFAMAGELVADGDTPAVQSDWYSFNMTIAGIADGANSFKIYFVKNGYYVTMSVGYVIDGTEVYRTTRQWADGGVYPIYETKTNGEAYLTWFAAGDKDATSLGLEL